MRPPRWLPSAVLGGALTVVSFLAWADLGTSSGLVIPYSGRLESNGAPVSGEVTLRFSIYNVASGGAACFTSGDIVTTASSGVFSVEIGPVTEECALGREMWLGVSVVEQGAPVELTGRQRVVPAIAASTSGTGELFVASILEVADDLFVGDAVDVGNTVDVGKALTVGDSLALQHPDARIAGGNTAGNLHIDANNPARGGDGRLYLNWYSGRGIVFGNGAGAASASIDASGNMNVNGYHSVSGNLWAPNNNHDSCAWTGWSCGETYCPDHKFMAGMQMGLDENCGGYGSDADFSSYRLYCCEL